MRDRTAPPADADEGLSRPLFEHLARETEVARILHQAQDLAREIDGLRERRG